jgi:hypothetical protein
MHLLCRIGLHDWSGVSLPYARQVGDTGRHHYNEYRCKHCKRCNVYDEVLTADYLPPSHDSLSRWKPMWPKAVTILKKGCACGLSPNACVRAKCC